MIRMMIKVKRLELGRLLFRRDICCLEERVMRGFNCVLAENGVEFKR